MKERQHPVQHLKNSALLLGVAFIFVASPTLGQVHFQEDGFSDLLHQAGEQEKLVFVDAYTDWCGWCKKMDQDTFSDSAVGAYMNDRFVSTKFNMEEGFGMKMAMRHRVSQYPHYLVFDAEGNLLTRLSGYLSPPTFIDRVEEAVYHKAPLPKLSVPLDYDIDYPDFYKNSFKKNKDRSFPSGQEVENWLAARDDLTEEISWSVMHRFVGGGTYALKIAALKDELIEKYGREEVISKLASLIFNDVKAAIKSQDERILENALTACSNFLGEDAEDYKLRYKLYYFQMTADWKSYGDVIDALTEGEAEDYRAVIEQAAATIESAGADSETTLRATEWMKDLSIKHPSYTNNLLYAKLLIKSGKNEAARAAVKTALDLAQAHEDNSQATLLLDQIP